MVSYFVHVQRGILFFSRIRQLPNKKLNKTHYCMVLWSYNNKLSDYSCTFYFFFDEIRDALGYFICDISRGKYHFVHIILEANGVTKMGVFLQNFA